jgi:hypothetical protein
LKKNIWFRRTELNLCSPEQATKEIWRTKNMKTINSILVVLFVVGLVASAQAQPALKLTFDSAPVVDAATYTFDAADIPSSGTVSINFNPPYVDVRDYGWDHTGPGTDFPTHYVDSGNYPDIVTPVTEGMQGGNAMFTALGTAGDPTKHNGYYINVDNGISVSGDFTAEAVFMANVLDPVTGTEYGLQNIFGNEKVVDATRGLAAWKFRILPVDYDSVVNADGEFQLWTGNTQTFFGENNVTGPIVTTGVWHHVAAVYTAGTNTLELFYDYVSQGTTAPVWGDTNQTNWWVGDWPANPAPRAFAGWIDAVAITPGVLAPGSFEFEDLSVTTWENY